MATLNIVNLGRCAYAAALAVQERLVEAALAANDDPAHLVLVEHDPPVITLGRTADPGNLRLPREQIIAAGTEIHETARGGDVTWHGPGQIVGYPIIHLATRGRDVRGHLRNLEQGIILALARFGIAGRRREGLTGVWVGPEKVAAIGIAVRRWVTYHGFALNVGGDLSGFDAIVPCGIRDCAVTSISRLAGREVGVGEVLPHVVECMTEALGFDAAKDARID